MRDEGRAEEAAGLLEALIVGRIDKRSRLVGLHCQLGNLYAFHLAKPGKGELSFREAPQLKASCELASLGVFHSLVAQKRDVEALGEMARFIAKYPSEGYAELRKKIAESHSETDKK